MPKATLESTIIQDVNRHVSVYRLTPPHKFKNNRKADRVLVDVYRSPYGGSAVVETCVPRPPSPYYFRRAFGGYKRMKQLLQVADGNITHADALARIGYDEMEV